MAKFFSPGTRSFYDDQIHGTASIPLDAVPITDEQHRLLLEAQADGRVIAVVGGAVVAEEPQPPTTEELLTALRRKRDRLLRESDFTQIPDAPLSTTARAAWATYRQALRDLPELYADNPASAVWPSAPDEETSHAS